MDLPTYLRLRREAAGLARVDVAARLAWEGPAVWLVTHFEERLAAIEEGREEPGDSALLALRMVFDFDVDVAKRQRAADRGELVLRPRVCTDCGCSTADPCELGGGACCSWSVGDLCSACEAERARLSRLVAGPARHLAALRRLAARPAERKEAA
jgi:hypothetical protein